MRFKMRRVKDRLTEINEANELLLKTRLEVAMYHFNKIQANEADIEKSEEQIKDCIKDIAIALLGRSIRFGPTEQEIKEFFSNMNQVEQKENT